MALTLQYRKHSDCVFVLLLFFVVWQGIYDPGQTQEKDGDRGCILLPPQPALLSRSDARSDGVE